MRSIYIFVAFRIKGNLSEAVSAVGGGAESISAFQRQPAEQK